MDFSKWTYSEKVRDHFQNPRNLLVKGEEYIPDGEGNIGSLACGDQMYVAIKVENGRIKDIRWLTYGCASAIASTSIMSEMAKGMTIEEAYNITPESIVKELDGLPEHKFHCSVLGDKALKASIDDYLKKRGLPNPYKEKSTKIICECKGITDKEIETLVAEKKIKTFEELQNLTGLGTVCGKCVQKAKSLLEEMLHIYGIV